MNIEWVRRYCLSLPHATETVQWNSLVFKVGGKLFAILALEPAKTWLSLKCTPEEFAELTERPGVIQAPYFARNQWVALETEDALPPAEIKRLVRASYSLVLEKLPRKSAPLCYDGKNRGGSTSMASPTLQLTFRDVLKIQSVRRLWLAQLISIFGDFLAVFAVFSLVTFQLHGTATQVSMILVAYLLPLAVISPLAGVYVDKWNVKWTMIASDLIRGVLILGLVFVRDLNAIYGIFFALSTVSAFFVPAQSVAVRTLAPAAGLLAVNGLMSQAIQGSQIISPAIAGLLVQWFGANACFIFDSFSFFFSAVMVMTLGIHRAPSPTVAGSSLLASMRQGFGFIFTHTVISFVILSMTAGMFAVRCFGALLSVYVRDVLVSNAALFGTLNSLIGIGMITGTQFLHRAASRVPQQFLVIYGLSGMGVAVLITAVFGRVASTAIGMLGLGFCAAFIMVPAQTLLQHETPHALLGRVSSSLMSLLAISQVLAMFVAGPVAQQLGIRNLYFGSAAMLGVIGAVGYAWLRKPKETVCLETPEPS